MNKTFVTKPSEVERQWFVVDAEGETLGRLASEIATVLRGKHKPIYSPSVDCGDYVIVVNAEKIAVTGRRLDQKIYYRHSGYMGGLKEITLRDQLERYPTRVIESAVKGMLPKNSLGRKLIKKLKVYAGPEHPHEAQQPAPLAF
jgi:large subunit ribosomal protein L13